MHLEDLWEERSSDCRWWLSRVHPGRWAGKQRHLCHPLMALPKCLCGAALTSITHCSSKRETPYTVIKCHFQRESPGSLPSVQPPLLPPTPGQPRDFPEGPPVGISGILSCLAAAGPGCSTEPTARALSSPDRSSNTGMDPNQLSQSRDVSRHGEP